MRWCNPAIYVVVAGTAASPLAQRTSTIANFPAVCSATQTVSLWVSVNPRRILIFTILCKCQRRSCWVHCPLPGAVKVSGCSLSIQKKVRCGIWEVATLHHAISFFASWWDSCSFRKLHLGFFQVALEKYLIAEKRQQNTCTCKVSAAYGHSFISFFIFSVKDKALHHSPTPSSHNKGCAMLLIAQLIAQLPDWNTEVTDICIPTCRLIS